MTKPVPRAQRPSLPLHRMRLTYSRGKALRCVSHLDIHLVWERTFRRAGLQVAYSQGFSPHPRLHLASALPLGFISANEVLDVWLEESEDNFLSPQEVQSRVQSAAPPGLCIEQAEEVPLSNPALQTQVVSSEYLAVPLDPIDESALQKAVESLLEAACIQRERRGKPYDLRPLIEKLEVQGQPGQNVLWMRLAAREAATGRPEEVMDALGYDWTNFEIERKRLILA